MFYILVHIQYNLGDSEYYSDKDFSPGLSYDQSTECTRGSDRKYG